MLYLYIDIKDYIYVFNFLVKDVEDKVRKMDGIDWYSIVGIKIFIFFILNY